MLATPEQFVIDDKSRHSEHTLRLRRAADRRNLVATNLCLRSECRTISARLRKHGAELVSSEVVSYGDSVRLCYIRGPEGLLIGLAEA